MDIFRKEFDNLWRKIEAHPFFADLERGALPFERFVYYIIQDCYFLYGWNRALFVAAARAPDWKTQQVCSKLLANSGEEIEKCRRLALTAGATENEINDLSRISPTCAAYTDWYLRVAYQETLEELASAMLVCPWTYASSICGGLNLGERFSKALVENYHIKKDVADPQIYCSPSYVEGIEEFKNLASRNSEKASDVELERRRVNFKTASDFEYKFWEMAYRNDAKKERLPGSYY